MIIDEPTVAKRLIDPMRRTIINILADQSMTESQLAKSLGLTESAVGHHLKSLEAAGLVSIVKREPERHGIIQKFYRARALSFVIDARNMPQDIARYFFPTNIERIRGALSCLSPAGKRQISTAIVEDLSKKFADTIAEVARGHAEEEVSSVDRETFTIGLYKEALLMTLNGSGVIPDSKNKGQPLGRKAR
ncbi:MAG: ArsR family transcriptional regulator [Candidatus Verstraetearchaeota archaeon]|nr:ArsR family transcriptional regulator [Candidatus Verstraetearchaeota archaeon]